MVKKNTLNTINIIIIIVFVITTLLAFFGFIVAGVHDKSKLIYKNGDEGNLDFGTFAADKPSSGLAGADLGSPCVPLNSNVDGLINLPMSYRVQECDRSKNLDCYGGIATGGGICLKKPGGSCETYNDCVPVYENTKTIMCIDNVCVIRGDTLNRKCSHTLDCKNSSEFSSDIIDTNHSCFKNNNEVEGRCKVDIYPRDAGCYFDSDCYKYDGNETECFYSETKRISIVKPEDVVLSPENTTTITVGGDEGNINIFFTNLLSDNNVYIVHKNADPRSLKLKDINSDNSTIIVEGSITDPDFELYLSDPSLERGVCVSKTPSMFTEEVLEGITFPCKGDGELIKGECYDGSSPICDINRHNFSKEKCLVGEDMRQILYKNKVFDIFPSLYENLKTTGLVQSPELNKGDMCSLMGESGCKPPYQCITINSRPTCRLPLNRQTCIMYQTGIINYCNEGFSCQLLNSEDLTYFYNQDICVENNDNPISTPGTFVVFNAEKNKYENFPSPDLEGETLISYHLNRNIISVPDDIPYLPPKLSSPSMVAYLTDSNIKIKSMETNTQYNIGLDKGTDITVKDILFDQDDNLLIFYSQVISTVRIRKIPFYRKSNSSPVKNILVIPCINHGLIENQHIFYIHENPINGNKDYTYISTTVKYIVTNISGGNIEIERVDGENIIILDNSFYKSFNGEYFYTYSNEYNLLSYNIINSNSVNGPLVSPEGFFRSGDKIDVGSLNVKTIQMDENQNISISDNILVQGTVYFNIFTDNYNKIEVIEQNNNNNLFKDNKVKYQGILLNSFYDTSIGSVPVLGTLPGNGPKIIKTPLQFVSGGGVVTLNKGCINYGLIILKKDEYLKNGVTINVEPQEEYILNNGRFKPNAMNNSITYAFDDTENISFSVCREDNKSYFLLNKEINTFDGNINLLQKVRYGRDDFNGSKMEYTNTYGNIYFSYENTVVSPTPSKLYFDLETRDDNKVDVSRIYDFTNNITGTDFSFINTYINKNSQEDPFHLNINPPVGIFSHMGKMNYEDNSGTVPVKIGFKQTSFLEDNCKPIPLKGKIIVGDNFNEKDNIFNGDIITFKNQEDIDVILNNPSSEIVISATKIINNAPDNNFNVVKKYLDILPPNERGIRTDNFFYTDGKPVSQNFIITSIEDYIVSVNKGDILIVKVNIPEGFLVDPINNDNIIDRKVKEDDLLGNPTWNFYVYNIYPLVHKRVHYTSREPGDNQFSDLYNIYDASGLYTSTKNDEFFNKTSFNKTSFNKILVNSTVDDNEFSIYTIADGYGQSYTVQKEGGEDGTTPLYTGNVPPENAYETSQIISRRGVSIPGGSGYSIADANNSKWIAFIADNLPYSAVKDGNDNITGSLWGDIFDGPTGKYWSFSLNGNMNEYQSLKAGGGVNQDTLPYFFNMNWAALIFTQDRNWSKFNGPYCLNYLWGRNFIDQQENNEPLVIDMAHLVSPNGVNFIPTMKAAVRPTFSGVIRIPGISSTNVHTKMYGVNNLFLSALQKYPYLKNIQYNNKPLLELPEDYVISSHVENGKFKAKGALNLGVDTNSFYLDKNTNMNLTNQILFRWPDMNNVTNNPVFKNNPVILKTFFENKFGNFSNSISYYALVNYPIVTKTGSGELFSEDIDPENRKNYLLQMSSTVFNNDKQEVNGVPITNGMYNGNNLNKLKNLQIDQFNGNIYGIF